MTTSSPHRSRAPAGARPWPCLALLLLLAAALPACAGGRDTAPAVETAGATLRAGTGTSAGVGPGLLLAEGSGWRSFFGNFTSRSHIIRICVVAMCLALFILMRKFTGGTRC